LLITYSFTYLPVYLLIYLFISLFTYLLSYIPLFTGCRRLYPSPRSTIRIGGRGLELYSLTECRIQRPHTSDCCAAYRSAGGGGRLMEERILRHQRRRHRITYVLWITSPTERSLADPRPHSEPI